MKKLLIFAIAILMTLSLLPSIAEARDNYPWDSNVPFDIGNNNTRHHIIPYGELTSFGRKIYPPKKESQGGLNEFFTPQNYNLIKKANLGASPDTKDLVAKYVTNDREAVQTVEQLFGWMQGNLVVGPSNRANDPKEKFDKDAFNCRQDICYNNAYRDLESHWKSNNDKEKKEVFSLLAKTKMCKIETATSGKCKWKKPS